MSWLKFEVTSVDSKNGDLNIGFKLDWDDKDDLDKEELAELDKILSKSVVVISKDSVKFSIFHAFLDEILAEAQLILEEDENTL